MYFGLTSGIFNLNQNKIFLGRQNKQSPDVVVYIGELIILR